MTVIPPTSDADWDQCIEQCQGQEILNLEQFDRGSSALLAMICQVKATAVTDDLAEGRAKPAMNIQIINAPEGLEGLATVAGVLDWFTWE